MEYLEFKLEPNNPDVGSKIKIQFDSDMIRLKLFDCDKYITWRFRNINSINKIERIRVALDIIEDNIKNKITKIKKL